jgi:solute carrier family 25 (mitochondrial oxoglutarate transporter), member 11
MAEGGLFSFIEGIVNVRPAIPFVVGCGSGIVATTCVQPIDTIKVRMQLIDRNLLRTTPWDVAKGLMTEGGVVNLYQGLSAAILRQLVYGTMRMGLFMSFEKKLEKRAQENGTTVSFGERALAGLGAGALAAFAGNPTEVVLIRMQADGLKPLEHRMRYNSALDALRRIAAQEGVLALWNGSAPTIVRAMSTNFGQLTFFSESKYQLKAHTDLSPEVRTALAAGIAGCSGAIISQPFDFIKTRLQNQTKLGYDASMPVYKGTLDCFTKVVRTQGFLRLFRDIWPYFMRVGPHS